MQYHPTLVLLLVYSGLKRNIKVKVTAYTAIAYS